MKRHKDVHSTINTYSDNNNLYANAKKRLYVIKYNNDKEKQIVNRNRNRNRKRNKKRNLNVQTISFTYSLPL